MDKQIIMLRCFLLLLAAAAANAAAGYKPKSSITVNTWTNANDKWFLYPEQDPSSAYYMPVIGKRPNFGIAVSGGGFRAVTFALGCVRGLYMMNLTQQARYLASNSGGSWFNSAFSYQDTIPVETFIGPYVPPQNLTKDNLKETAKGAQGAFASTISNGAIISNALAGATKDTIAQSDKGPGAWSDSVGHAFLEPYNLNADKSTFTANGTKGPIHQELNNLDVNVYAYQGDNDSKTVDNIIRPYPIILGSAFQQVNNFSLFYPTEFTPEYIGIPPVYPNEDPNKTIGGGFVDTYGFNSFAPAKPPKVPAALAATIGKVPPGYGVLPESAHSRHLLQAAPAAAAALSLVPGANPSILPQNGAALGTATNGAAPGAATNGAAPAPFKPGTIALNGTAPKTATNGATPGVNATSGEAPVAGLANNKLLPLQTEVNSSFLVPLKVAAGISSSFLAQGLTPANSEAMKEFTGTEELKYWNNVNFKGSKQSFADGGGTDNLAVTPFIRRKVKYIVACVAASEYLGSDTKPDDYALSQWDISALFGAVPLKHKNIRNGKVNGMPPEVFNKVTQVFPKAGWTALFNGLQQSVAAGGPVHHLAEYTVLDNPYQAVHGGWKVKVLWVVNAVQKNWEKELPKEVRDQLNASRQRRGGLYATGEAESDAEADAKGRGTAELKRYPYISTFDANYSPDTTGMLNQQATWQMLELRPQLQKMLAGSGAKVGPINNVGQPTEDKKVGVRAPPKDSKQKSAAGAALVGGWRYVLAAGGALLMAPALLAA